MEHSCLSAEAIRWLAGKGAGGQHLCSNNLLDDAVNCYYKNPMIIVWDEPKREANIAKHGIDFADIGEAFFVTAMIGQAKDDRYFALGELNGMIIVIFATLGTEAISIISARPASRKERRLLP